MTIDHVALVGKPQALSLVNKYHYSKVFPRINKFFIGGFSDKKLVAICTLGYGVRPLHTIKKIFPTLEVKDYFEIGKLCVADEMPRNTESNFIAKCIKLIKSHHTLSHIKLLFSWADGIIGKPGYIYQASNMYYGGYIWSEMYINENGTRIHPRTVQGLSPSAGSRSWEVTTAMGLQKYKGLQFRYAYPICNKQEWKRLQRQSTVEWTRGNYPKDASCKWMKQISKGNWEPCNLPEFKQTKYIVVINPGFNVVFEADK